MGVAARIQHRLDPDALGICRRRDGVDGVSHDLGKLHRLHVEPDLAGDDSRNVEHVLDDLRQRRGIAFDGLDRLVSLVRRNDTRAQEAGVSEDRVQRRPQFVRQAGQEVVLDSAGLLDARVQARVLQRDRRPGRDAHREPFVLLGKPSDVRMAEEQAADDVAPSPFHRDGQIAAYGQVATRHAVMRRIVTVPRVLGDVGAANDGGAFECRIEHFRVPGHRELGERLAGYAGDGVQRIGLAVLVDHVVEEGAEFGRGQLSGRVRHRLNDLVAIEIRRDNRADVVQGLRDLRILLRAAGRAPLPPA